LLDLRSRDEEGGDTLSPPLVLLYPFSNKSELVVVIAVIESDAKSIDTNGSRVLD
jgi:hypothetical protein